jgi:hypothetical protein
MVDKVTDLSGAQLDLSGAKPQTPFESAWEALKIVAGYVGVILYIAIALRFVAFATSEIVHKPISYRILTAVYTFIFAPLFIPYYLYRAFQATWGKMEHPSAYSVFPIYSFPEREPYDLIKALTGYKDSLEQSMAEKRQQENAVRLAYLARS